MSTASRSRNMYPLLRRKNRPVEHSSGTIGRRRIRSPPSTSWTGHQQEQQRYHGRTAIDRYDERENDTDRNLRSNDSSEDILNIPIVDGYPVSYSCDRYFDDETRRNVELKFRYELETAQTTIQPDDNGGNGSNNSTSGLGQELPGLQWGVLWSVAKSIGLHSCDIDQQDVDAWSDKSSTMTTAAAAPPPEDAALPPQQDAGGRSLTFVQEQHPGSTHVISLTTDPVNDNKDMRCELLTAAEGMSCVPVEGLMNVEYIGTDEIAVEKYVLHHIQNEINSQHALTGDITRMVYVGDKYQFHAAPTEVESTDTDFVALAVSLSLVAIVVLATAVGYKLSRKRRRRRGESTIVVTKSITVMDIGKVHTRSTDAHGEESLSMPNSDGSPSSNSLTMRPMLEEDDMMMLGERMITARVPDQEMPLPPPPPPLLLTSADARELPTLSDSDEPEDELVSSSSSGSSSRLRESEPETVLMEDILPPSPPPPQLELVDSAEPLPQLELVDSAEAKPPPPPVVDELHEVPVITPIVDVLPPLPPTAPASKQKGKTKSKTMKKKRRRKKKKKKKPVLKRVNSRENITEMETIAEAGEECETDDEEDGSDDYGSDYWSTDDEDSSSLDRGPGSRPGSRDPSPARSLRGDGSGGGGSSLPPPIEEEPKIKRLRPPRGSDTSNTRSLDASSDEESFDRRGGGGPGSRDPSPARSRGGGGGGSFEARGRPGSRDPSPARSRGSSGSATNRNTSTLPMPSAMILEEPKIRRLPPPWTNGDDIMLDSFPGMATAANPSPPRLLPPPWTSSDDESSFDRTTTASSSREPSPARSFGNNSNNSNSVSSSLPPLVFEVRNNARLLPPHWNDDDNERFLRQLSSSLPKSCSSGSRMIGSRGDRDASPARSTSSSGSQPMEEEEEGQEQQQHKPPQQQHPRRRRHFHTREWV